ncbi:MAG: molybdenum cofactor guanylyltransferase [Thermoguttaceae bacterium]|jgi:molybdopterin-guanine dinucleotide biosynthesis protein A|nr:molybdenum cofactor guanylyltransferase [Thermoguttaceae bacterium]
METTPRQTIVTGGIVLCGGKSRRMGSPKAMLPFGPERMLQRVVRLLGEAVRPIVVVAAEGQELPELPGEVLVARDRCPDRGPLEGIAAGLRAIGELVEAAYVTACDVPLLVPAFVRRVIELGKTYEIAVPHVRGFDEPLSAVYCRSVLPRIDALLALGRLRPAFLFDEARTLRIDAEKLADVDPELLSLANVNDPQDYAAALRRAGFLEPQRRVGWARPERP